MGAGGGGTAVAVWVLVLKWRGGRRLAAAIGGTLVWLVVVYLFFGAGAPAACQLLQRRSRSTLHGRTSAARFWAISRLPPGRCAGGQGSDGCISGGAAAAGQHHTCDARATAASSPMSAPVKGSDDEPLTLCGGRDMDLLIHRPTARTSCR